MELLCVHDYYFAWHDLSTAVGASTCSIVRSFSHQTHWTSINPLIQEEGEGRG